MIIGAVLHLVFAVRSGDADLTTWKNDCFAILAGVGLVWAGDAAVSATKQDVVAVKQAVVSGDTSMLTKEETSTIQKKDQ